MELSEGTVELILNLSTRWWGVIFMTRLLYRGERALGTQRYEG